MSRSKENVKRSLYVGLARTGRIAGLGHLRGARRPNTLRVLMYHKITDTAPNSIAVSVTSFAEQQRFLRDYYAVVSLEQVRRWFFQNEPLPARAVLLTFDDGYRDNLLNAYPILARYGHPAVLFVPTSFVGSTRPLPHDHGFPPNPTLNWDEIRQMLDLFEVGAHGCTHRVLTRIPSKEAHDEIVNSKRAIEARLNLAVRAFSYPKGSIRDFSPELEKYVRHAGFDIAFTTRPGIVRHGSANPLALRRHNVEDYGLAYFRALLDGSANLLAIKDTLPGYWFKELLHRRATANDRL
jgi:peptidoglycan/xylan/chitin deacetylase (PgdA/CDA1 family)